MFFLYITIGSIAHTFYNNAITASILDWGDTLASATTYLAHPSTPAAAKIGGDKVVTKLF